jgi:hypothetical protein
MTAGSMARWHHNHHHNYFKHLFQINRSTNIWQLYFTNQHVALQSVIWCNFCFKSTQLQCGIYCILKIPHYIPYTDFSTHVTIFCDAGSYHYFLWGESGWSLWNIFRIYSLSYIPSTKNMQCLLSLWNVLHAATSVVSVWSWAMESGGLCLPWSFYKINGLKVL